jgi:biopolymer transport protein ExbD
MAAKVGGGGGGKYDLGQNSDINVTPFVDIMLVLLIVMMVAVPVATLAIKVDLPPATPPPPGAKPKPPTFIYIRDNGSMQISNPDRGYTTTGLPRLAADLVVNLGPDARNQSVLIKADRTVRYEQFMGVVDQLQTDGFYKVSLIVENAPGSST